MGLMEKWNQFKENRRQKRITSNKNLIRRDKVNKDERLAAISFFCELDDLSLSVPILLSRFEFSADNGIVDTREKEKALEGITEKGEASITHIKDHLRRSTRIAWPLKALSNLVSEEEVIQTLKDCLDFNDVKFDQAKVDKNYDLLCYLADYRLENYAGHLAHFLDQHDERIRFAAAELLVAQNDGEVPHLLERFIYDISDENRRLRKTIFLAFSEKGWKLSDPKKNIEQPPRGFTISSNGIIAKA